MFRPLLRTGIAAIAMAVVSGPLPAEPLRVFAAASLTDALAQVAPLAKSSGLEFTVNLAGSNTLVRQVLEGAGTDLVITADETSMNRLIDGGEVRAHSVKTLLSNHLVIVAPLDFSPLAYCAELAQPRFQRIAIADEATAPAGLYAHKALEAAGIWSAIGSRIVPTENVRGALAAVESGNAQAAAVYRTDAAISSKVRIIWEFKDVSTPRIVYPAAVPKSAPHPEAAKRLLALLSSPKAREIFKKFGFEVFETQ